MKSIVIPVNSVFECAAINPAGYSHFAADVGLSGEAVVTPASPQSVNCTTPFTHEIAQPLPAALEADDVELIITDPGTPQEQIVIRVSPDNNDDTGTHEIQIKACYTDM